MTKSTLGRSLLLSFAAIMGSAFTAATASADPATYPQSNTVPSAQLITDFSVIKDAAESDVSTIINLFKVGKENQGPIQLTVSADEISGLCRGQRMSPSVSKRRNLSRGIQARDWRNIHC
jgi:hypothetical protein